MPGAKRKPQHIHPELRELRINQSTSVTKTKEIVMTTEEIKARLMEKLTPGREVYTALKHVSKSGMTRHISVYIVENGQINDISWEASHILGYKRADNDGLKVGGSGMDMGFHLVYSLSRALYPDGFKLPEGKHGRNGDTSGFDRDGGYALLHRWI